MGNEESSDYGPRVNPYIPWTDDAAGVVIPRSEEVLEQLQSQQMDQGEWGMGSTSSELAPYERISPEAVGRQTYWERRDVNDSLVVVVYGILGSGRIMYMGNRPTSDTTFRSFAVIERFDPVHNPIFVFSDKEDTRRWNALLHRSTSEEAKLWYIVPARLDMPGDVAGSVVVKNNLERAPCLVTGVFEGMANVCYRKGKNEIYPINELAEQFNKRTLSPPLRSAVNSFIRMYPAEAEIFSQYAENRAVMANTGLTVERASFLRQALARHAEDNAAQQSDSSGVLDESEMPAEFGGRDLQFRPTPQFMGVGRNTAAANQNMGQSANQTMGQNMVQNTGQNMGQNMGQNTGQNMGQNTGQNMQRMDNGPMRPAVNLSVMRPQGQRQ